MSRSIACLIVDDEPLAREVIETHMKQVPQLDLLASCQHAMEAFELIAKQPIDLVFLDIQMPVLTGLEFVRHLPQPPAIIFTTAYRDYAVESYELDVVDYLLKPISFPRFFKAVNKFMSTRKEHSPVLQQLPKASSGSKALFVNVNKKQIKISLDEVFYIESLKDYIRIHMQTSTVMTKEKISVFAQKLPEHFLRIHRSYIVNTQHLTAFTAQDVEIKDLELPIGGSYRKEVEAFFKKQF